MKQKESVALDICKDAYDQGGFSDAVLKAEQLGFHHTEWCDACDNFTIEIGGVCSACWSSLGDN